MDNYEFKEWYNAEFKNRSILLNEELKKLRTCEIFEEHPEKREFYIKKIIDSEPSF